MLATVHRRRGFTAVEMLVVLGIIGLLLAIVLPSLSQSRANARDKSRVNDINTIALAFQLHREVAGDYPTGHSDVEIGTGGTLDSIVQSRIGKTPVDPSDTNGTDSNYGYFYDDSLCGGQPGVYVQAFETSFDEAGDCDSGGRAYTIELP